jgi:RNA polymerase-binding transcription factor DksA
VAYDGPVSDTAGTAPDGTGIDLDRIEADLAGVETALARLDDGTYWTCEVTGAEIPTERLAADPTVRRAS